LYYDAFPILGAIIRQTELLSSIVSPNGTLLFLLVVEVANPGFICVVSESMTALLP